MLPLVAPRAVIELVFDPILTVGGWSVRLETLAIALTVFVALVIAASVARATPVDLTRPADAPGDEPGELNHLRADDLLYIAVAALPGAVIGARLGYALLHLDFYGADPGALLDIGQGGFQLSLGVVGGVVTAAIVAGLLGAPLGRWLHAMVLPVLVALAGGKAAMVLGGSGQGQLSDVSWATTYPGPGPWGSLAPALPSHPAQVYEVLATVVVLLIVMTVVAFDAFRGRNGGAFLFAIALWAIARAIVATTWRDPEILGPLRMDQLISIVIAVLALVLMVVVGAASAIRGRRAAARAAATPVDPAASARRPGEPDWPDPTSRPWI